MTTPRDLINLALTDAGIIGVGQTALAEDVNNALTRVNFMLAQWNRSRYLVYHLVDLSVVSTGASVYTIGPGGDIDVAVRPDRLENGNFFRQLVQSSPNQIDYPLELLESYEDYNQIALKQLKSFGGAVFYDPDFPLGKLKLYPVLQAGLYELHILVKMILSQFTGLSQVLSIPNEYYQAIYLTLAEILRTAYRLPPDAALSTRALGSRGVLRGANTALARLRMPAALVRPGLYNVFSDQVY